LRILLVDDDPIGREVTTALLQSRGHAVRAAGEEEEAVAAAAQQAFDLILMDINLSEGGCGLSAARRIRAAQGTRADLRILALTADAFGDHEAYLRAGIDGVLLKPLGLETDLGAALGGRPAA
jgi:CheY-like chemotaxis protein